MDRDPTKTVTFYGDRTLTLEQIQQNLIKTLDLNFAVFSGLKKERELLRDISEDDRELYRKGKKIFVNEKGLPDGSVIQGIVLNSFARGAQGFGSSLNTEEAHGADVIMKNVKIKGLRLSVDEWPALYFKQCAGLTEEEEAELNDNGTWIEQEQLGTIGSVFYLPEVIGPYGDELVERHGKDPSSLESIEYLGNPFADAQIANAIHGDPLTKLGTTMFSPLLDWAQGLRSFPSECVDFLCGDAMFHHNKGVVGLRMDGIEGVYIEDLTVSDLSNESPPLSDACRSYPKAHASGCPGGEEREGEEDEDGELIGKGTDLRGVSVAGGDVVVSGKNRIRSLKSKNGDAIGLDLIGDAILEFADESDVKVSGVYSAADVKVDVCSVRYGEDAEVLGDVPDDKVESVCKSKGGKRNGGKQKNGKTPNTPKSPMKSGISMVDSSMSAMGDGSSQSTFMVTVTGKDLMIIGLFLLNVVMMLILCQRCCTMKREQYQPVAVRWESETEDEKMERK